MKLINLRTTGASFFDRHKHLLTVIGAMIVFATFVVKERFGESWRQVSERVEAAKHVYSLESTMRAQGVAIRELQLTVERMNTSAYDRQEFGDKYISMQADSMPVWFGHQADLSRIESVANFIGQLPNNKQLLDELSYLKQKEDKWESDYERENGKWTSDQMEEKLFPNIHAERKTSLSTDHWEEDYKHMLRDFKFWHLEVEVATLETDALREAEKTIEANKYRSNLAVWISSFFMFAAGA